MGSNPLSSTKCSCRSEGLWRVSLDGYGLPCQPGNEGWGTQPPQAICPFGGVARCAKISERCGFQGHGAETRLAARSRCPATLGPLRHARQILYFRSEGGKGTQPPDHPPPAVISGAGEVLSPEIRARASEAVPIPR